MRKCGTTNHLFVYLFALTKTYYTINLPKQNPLAFEMVLTTCQAQIEYNLSKHSKDLTLFPNSEGRHEDR